MPFRVLYLEDRDASLIIKTIEDGVWSGPDIKVFQEEKVENLPTRLKEGFDLLLADIGFPAEEYKDDNRLSDILAHVSEHSAEWRKNNPELGLASLPVIVYTSLTEDIAECLTEHRHRLYDIWDKSTASPEYVAWRVGVVARDVERHRPGRALQQAIGQLKEAAPWHDRVLYMLRQYRSAWSELDQIQRCGEMVEYIAAQIGCDHSDGEAMWKALAEWELIDRAADRRVRGHARHSLHVFWLGYVVLNEPALRDVWRTAWKSLLKRNSQLKKVDWLSALNGVWFLAAVFHDVGYAAQDAVRVLDAVDRITLLLNLKLVTRKRTPSWGKYKEVAEDILSDFKASDSPGYGQMRSDVKAHFARTVKDRHPDHGCISAGRLAAAKPRTTIAESYLREAARAVALHSMMPAVDVASGLSWDVDPLATLLLLLDQLQTWDRERPEDLKSDWPERAELTHIKITPGQRPRVDLRISYLVRPHVERENEVFEKVEQGLRRVLEHYPIATIRRMQPRLPFDFAVEFFLADTKIDQVVPESG
jgi:hypothetical protein